MNMSESLDIDKFLEYSEFDDSAPQTIIAADGFEIYYDILLLGDSDIVNLEKGFSDRTIAAWNISFGFLRTKIMKATIHRAQDFRSISCTSSLIGISNAA